MPSNFSSFYFMVISRLSQNKTCKSAGFLPVHIAMNTMGVDSNLNTGSSSNAQPQVAIVFLGGHHQPKATLQAGHYRICL